MCIYPASDVLIAMITINKAASSYKKMNIKIVRRKKQKQNNQHFIIVKTLTGKIDEKCMLH